MKKYSNEAMRETLIYLISTSTESWEVYYILYVRKYSSCEKWPHREKCERNAIFLVAALEERSYAIWNI